MRTCYSRCDFLLGDGGSLLTLVFGSEELELFENRLRTVHWKYFNVRIPRNKSTTNRQTEVSNVLSFFNGQWRPGLMYRVYNLFC